MNVCFPWQKSAAEALLFIVLATVVGCAAVAPQTSNSLRVKGSDTMLILNRRLAEGFMRSHPGMSIRVEGGGTGSGVQAIVEGRADVCAASRPLTAPEVEELFGRFNTIGVRSLIAQDALSVFVHVENPVDNLALDQLRGLFSGSVVNWSQVGGAELPVIAVVRPPNSGTFRFFRDHVLLGSPYAASARTAARTVDVVEAVRGEVGAIGYGGLAFGDGVVHCSIDGVAPTAENVQNGTYPLVRYLTFFTTERPAGLAKTFIDWCVGADGQQIVAEVGYIPLWQR